MDGALTEGPVQQLQKQQQQHQQQHVTKKKSKNKKKNSSSEVVIAKPTSTCSSSARTKTINSRPNVYDDDESKVNENGLGHQLKQQFHPDEQVNGLVEQSPIIKRAPETHYCELTNGGNIIATISNATTTTTITPTIRPIVNFEDMKKLRPACKLNGHHSPPMSTSIPPLLNEQNKNECNNVDHRTGTIAKKSKRKGNHKKQLQNNNASNNCTNNSNCGTNKQGNKDDYSRRNAHRNSEKLEEAMVAATEIICSNNCRSLTTCVYDAIEKKDQDDQQQQLPNGYLASSVAAEVEEEKCHVHTDPSLHNNITTITANNTCKNLSAPRKTIINDNGDAKVIKENNSSSNSESESQQQQQQQEQSKVSETNSITPKLDLSTAHIEYKEYESELQMHDIMRLIQAELSEPYSIYTYRYFIYNWPKLCFLAAHGNDYVGAIVCKLDMHLNVRRGYIAMLAVRKEYRKLKIGTTLVQKAIEAMLADNADEVVLETEMSNVPALRLYENLGFVRDKRLFRYYLNGVDALRLKLWFR